MFSSNATLLLLEAVVYASAVLLTLFLPTGKRQWLRQAAIGYRAIARRQALSVITVIAFVLVVRGLLILFLPTPVPGVHDEFSYILAGDTFASGRLTNPTHPLWKSLETFYVIQKPTYASMYPPAQGIAIALGDILGGHPWIGIYLSVAGLCGAICWMLQGWVPAQWALLGGLIAALRFGIYSYWSESYWGGAVAALGGALVLGALPRLFRRRRTTAAVVLGLGLLILANSRPFEGLLLTIPVFGLMLARLWRAGKPGIAAFLRQAALPLTVVLVLGMGAMTFYFWRVTGNPLEMPYQLHSAMYEVTGPFLWQPLRKAPSYRYAVMEKYHVERQTAAFLRARSPAGWLSETGLKAESLAMFYFWPAVLPALIAIPFLRNNSKVRFCLIAIAIMFVGLTLEIWPMTLHYHAPITAAMLLLLVQVIRFWRTVRWRGRPVGLAISRTIPLFCAGMLAFRLGAAVLHVPMPEHGLAPWFTVSPGNLYRDRILGYLETQPGQQLVLVRYSDRHHVDEEWVHNAADIDGSKIVWARYADEAENEKLLTYFQGRRVWIVDVDAKAGQLAPYSTTMSSIRSK